MPTIRSVFLGLAATALFLAGCGDDDSATAAGDSGARPTVVVTTSVLGDVVESLSGGQFDVVTVMPAGADPHDFQASAKEAAEMREADALVVNGGGLEEGLVDVIDAAEQDGVPTFAALDAVDSIEFGATSHGEDEDHDDHAEEEHDDHADEDHDDHAHEGADPHFFQDPARTAVAVEAIGDFLVETVDGVDVEAIEDATVDYVTELEELDADIEAMLAALDDDRRILVTNHDSFGYFADRYGFEVVGTVVPSGSTADGASAGELAELAELVSEEGVPAIFAETVASDDLAQTLADEVGDDVAVVELFSDSLGESDSGGGSYVEMIRTNAARIAEALA